MAKKLSKQAVNKLINDLQAKKPARKVMEVRAWGIIGDMGVLVPEAFGGKCAAEKNKGYKQKVVPVILTVDERRRARK